MQLECGNRRLDLSRPRVMGVLNVTPDSFSDGGAFLAAGQAVARAREMVAEGADIIDIGGESTRPGADPVSIEDELTRVIPVIEALHGQVDALLSVDTSKPEVMRAAVAAGADIINDVCALQAPGALEAAAEGGAAVCLMHMQGEPRTMQADPRYENVVTDVAGFLRQRVAAAEAAGMARARLLVDPGFGFGKTLAHNLSLLKHLPDLVDSGVPVLVGLSRKSMIGKLLDLPVERRLQPSVALAVIAVMQGARIVRVHDVAPTVQALAMCAAVEQAE
ncbi:dihydropteroate synthase [Thiohalobacter thiocyanaticus]|uniref:Dihydropteroate synthase n=1 Tax=Thiohalobacter thiocyanaticus TaxID=585455 RepID=A0A1Z4VR32_9GAMM|nr:dihydropteroate synthase [Thiohalobacter thiocyanaticus]BAZ94091.1 dihydropteroate synthase [Thiohalobacter thiocyanaticus]